MKIKVPKSLSAEAKRWFRQLVKLLDPDDDAGRLILAAALESFDRVRQAQVILSKDGLVITDRHGQKRAHPASTIERDGRIAMTRNLRALKISAMPLRRSTSSHADEWDNFTPAPRP